VGILPAGSGILPERSFVSRLARASRTPRRGSLPDHMHLLFQSWIKEQETEGENVFWSLDELMHSHKSFTAKEINQREGMHGGVWD
jgi:hypothetical protein